MALRAILFDLDGTLIDQFIPIYRAFGQVIEQLGFPVPDFETVKKSIGGASENTMAKLIGQSHAKEGVKLLRPIFEKEMLNGLIALPGANEILQKCRQKNIKTAVLTNKYGPHARTVCEHLNFSKYLEFTIGADDTEWKKPNPSLTKLALEKMGTNNKNTLYVGDSPYDFQTATNASMPCILLPTGTHSEEELSNLGGNVVVKKNLFQIFS